MNIESKNRKGGMHRATGDLSMNALGPGTPTKIEISNLSVGPAVIFFAFLLILAFLKGMCTFQHTTFLKPTFGQVMGYGTMLNEMKITCQAGSLCLSNPGPDGLVLLFDQQQGREQDNAGKAKNCTANGPVYNGMDELPGTN